MKSFIVYKSDGVIVRTGSCVDSDFDLQAAEGEFVIEGIADDTFSIISDGNIVDGREINAPNTTELISQTQKESRANRNVRLQKSDWTQFPDSPLSDTKKAEWATYRQSLRDIPETYSGATSLDDIIWPTEPR